jgi:hypothetical protein
VAGSKVVNNMSGSGIVYLKINGLGCKVIRAGKGLYLALWNKGSAVGSGLYIKSGFGYADGRGLLLGPNSPF